MNAVAVSGFSGTAFMAARPGHLIGICMGFSREPLGPQASSVPSKYVPDANGEAPLPAWKRIDLMQGVLPERFQGRAEVEGGTISLDEYQRRLADGDA